MPLIQLHSSTNRSLPLISLFWQSVPKCRLPKNPASPRGKPRGRRLTLLPRNERLCPVRLRADSIRPYSLGGETAAIQRTAQLRTLREAKSLPYRWLLPRSERLCPVRLRADAIRPDSGVYKTAALQSAHSPEPIIFRSIRGNAEHIRRTQLRDSAANGLVNLNQLLQQTLAG